MRILVVDDEESVAELLATVIRSEGDDALVALSGAEALRLLAGKTVDGVFLDLAMPDMDGMEVLKQIRGRYPTVPVMILSGHANDEHEREAMALGAVAVVRKPAELAALTEAVLRLKRG